MYVMAQIAAWNKNLAREGTECRCRLGEHSILRSPILRAHGFLFPTYSDATIVYVSVCKSCVRKFYTLRFELTVILANDYQHLCISDVD
jgi:hypothetical protein